VLVVLLDEVVLLGVVVLLDEVELWVVVPVGAFIEFL
jgi:hypothetical protein